MAARKKTAAPSAAAATTWISLATIKVADLVTLLARAAKVANEKVLNCSNIRITVDKANRTIAAVATDMIRTIRAEAMAASVDADAEFLFPPKQATVFLGAIGNKAQVVALKLRSDSARLSMSCGSRKLEVALATEDAMPTTSIPSPDEDWSEITPFNLNDLLDGTEWATVRLDTPVVALYPDAEQGTIRAESFDGQTLAAVVRNFTAKGKMPKHLLFPVVAKPAFAIVTDYAEEHEQSVLVQTDGKTLYAATTDGTVIVGTVTADGEPSNVDLLVQMVYPWSVKLPKAELVEAIKAAKAATANDGSGAPIVLRLGKREDGGACLQLRSDGEAGASSVTDEVAITATSGDLPESPWCVSGEKFLSAVELACKVCGGKDVYFFGAFDTDPYRVCAAFEEGEHAGEANATGLWMFSPLRMPEEQAAK